MVGFQNWSLAIRFRLVAYSLLSKWQPAYSTVLDHIVITCLVNIESFQKESLGICRQYTYKSQSKQKVVFTFNARIDMRKFNVTKIYVKNNQL